MRGTGCVGYLYATSGWFNRSEPPRTLSNENVWKSLRAEGVQTEIIDRSEMGGSEKEIPDLHLQREMLLDGMNNKPDTRPTREPGGAHSLTLFMLLRYNTVIKIIPLSFAYRLWWVTLS